MSHLLLKILLGVVFLGLASFVIIAISIWDYSTRTDLVPADAAIVLGAAPWGDEPSPVFRERINHALNLYRSRTVRKIIFTGGPRDAEVARSYAIANGIPDRDILWETTSRTTEQDLQDAREIAKREGLTTFLVVSDPLHMRRAMLIAEDVGLVAHTAPTPTTRYKSWNTQAEFLARESVLYLYYLIARLFIHSRYALLVISSRFCEKSR